MKTKCLISSAILVFSIVASAVLLSPAAAQESVQPADIQYPVERLGNCADETACKAYCDKPVNVEACLNFAQENNLMSAEEIQMARKFMAAGGRGPGGCQTQDACKAYCDDVSRIEECVTFAEENDLLPPAELAEAKKVRAAIARGVKPPSCGSKKSCDEYCDNPDHTEECITFAEAAGFLQGKELEDARKMLQALKRGVKPPPCRGKEACDEYCSSPNNMELCMTFAMEAGFMTEQEKADSQKMLRALKKGVKPPQCRGKDECDIYCSRAEHFEECVNFAEAAGFMTAEEATMARKTKGKGAGGCQSKDECEAFCNNPDNQEACFNFAKENGLIPEEDLKQMEEGKQRFRESLNQAPPEVLDCLNSILGSDMMEKLKSGNALPPREVGEQMRSCYSDYDIPGNPARYEKMGPPPDREGRGNINQGQAGPGGCRSPEECQSFCETNPQECQNLGPQSEGPAVPLEPGSQAPGAPDGSVPPAGQQPPLNDNPSPPASFLDQNSLLGSIVNILLGKFNR